MERMTKPPVCDYEGSDYQASFWGGGVRDYEDRAEAIALKRLQDTASAGSCHLLFIAESAQSRLRETLLGLRGSTTLTVSDIPEFARHGGMIGFIRRDRRIRLEINEFNARNAGLRISSKLLEVEVRVYSAPGSKP